MVVMVVIAPAFPRIGGVGGVGGATVSGGVQPPPASAAAPIPGGSHFQYSTYFR
jgi:hypothetical protein